MQEVGGSKTNEGLCWDRVHFVGGALHSICTLLCLQTANQTSNAAVPMMQHKEHVKLLSWRDFKSYTVAGKTKLASANSMNHTNTSTCTQTNAKKKIQHYCQRHARFLVIVCHAKATATQPSNVQIKSNRNSNRPQQSNKTCASLPEKHATWLRQILRVPTPPLTAATAAWSCTNGRPTPPPNVPHNEQPNKT